VSIVGFEVLDDRTVGDGGFLRIRRLRVRLVRDDGTRSAEGLYDFIERPIGRDAVVLVLYRRGGGRTRVLLRDGIRVPLYFGRAGASGPPALHAELVAGIVETGEESEAGLRARAVAEALEEAGLTITPESLVRLGAPTFPTAGMCPEEFHFLAAEIAPDAREEPPAGDGSPFEEGARLRWLDLDHAIAACARGEIPDMKTELGLRRLRDHLRAE